MSLSRVKGFLLAYLLFQDAFLMLLAVHLATVVWLREHPGAALAGMSAGLSHAQLVLFVLPAWLATFYLQRLYDLDRILLASSELWAVVNSITAGLVSLVIGSFALNMEGISRLWMLLCWILAVLFLASGRLLFRYLAFVLQRRQLLVNRTLIVGGNDEADLILQRLRYAAAGFVPVGFVAPGSPGALAIQDLPFYGSPQVLPQIVAAQRIDALLIASSAFTHKQIVRILRLVKGLPVNIHISSGLFEVISSRVLVKEVGGVPMTVVRPVGLGRFDKFAKRVFDLVGALLALVILSPLLAAVAVAIKVFSRGPVLFKQERIGKGGTPFQMYKFRSMVVNADSRRHRQLVAEQISKKASSKPLGESRGAYKGVDNPRITRVGRWIRKYSIDELPQLFNVILGDMSLVGPRPPITYEVELYQGWMKKRLAVTPGMTGWWQVSGRANLPYSEMVKLDLFYIDNWSLLLDFYILVRTIPVLLTARGAY